MPAPKPSLADIERGISRYEQGDRPWRQTLNRVDWFIVHNEQLYPLKYTFALATDVPVAEYTTDQMKAAMSHLNLTYHSLKAHVDSIQDFDAQVRRSLADDAGRASRLATAPTIPKLTYTFHLTFNGTQTWWRKSFGGPMDIVSAARLYHHFSGTLMAPLTSKFTT